MYVYANIMYIFIFFRSLVRNCLSGGNRCLAIHNGIDGLLNENLYEIQWSEVNGWAGLGGTLIGTRSTLVEDKFAEIAEKLNKFEIRGIVAIGGFEVHNTTHIFKYHREWT